MIRRAATTDEATNDRRGIQDCYHAEVLPAHFLEVIFTSALRTPAKFSPAAGLAPKSAAQSRRVFYAPCPHSLLMG